MSNQYDIENLADWMQSVYWLAVWFQDCLTTGSYREGWDAVHLGIAVASLTASLIYNQETLGVDILDDLVTGEANDDLYALLEVHRGE